MKNFLFIGSPLPAKAYGWVALFVRVFAGLMMLTHALPKLEAFPSLSMTFPDPLGVGSQMSLVLSLFAEGLCSLLLIFGVLTRLAVLPLIFNMSVAIFVIHHGAPFSAMELAVMYLFLYLIILALGPGRFSIDRFLFREAYDKV